MGVAGGLMGVEVVGMSQSAAVDGACTHREPCLPSGVCRNRLVIALLLRRSGRLVSLPLVALSSVAPPDWCCSVCLARAALSCARRSAASERLRTMPRWWVWVKRSGGLPLRSL